MGRGATFASALRRSALFVEEGNVLLSKSIEQGSARAYSSALRCFEEFLTSTSFSLGVVDIPATRPAALLRPLISSQGVIPSFIVFCSEKGLAASTVSAYVEGLRFFATDFGGSPTIPDLGLASRLISGLAKSGKRPLPRKTGISVTLLRQIVAVLPNLLELTEYDVTLYKACFVVAYFGAFRVSEFLSSADDIKLLSRDKVSFSPDGSVRFDLTKTKNNSSGPSQEVIFPRLVADPICPVSAVKCFMASRPVTEGSAPFFIDSGGEDVTPKKFTEVLRLALTGVGVTNALAFSSKSFRVGAASDAFALAIPTSSIQALGRWRSAAFMDYVRSGARALLASGVQTTLAAHMVLPQTATSPLPEELTQSLHSPTEMRSASRPRPRGVLPLVRATTVLAAPLNLVVGSYQRRISSFYAYRPAVARRRY